MQFQQNEPLFILGAVYGKQDVTNTVRDLVQKGFTQIRADNTNFSDSFYGVQKTLAIVYQYGNNPPGVLTAKEGSIAAISPHQKSHQWHPFQADQITILGAAYGPSDVTDKVVKRMNNGGLDITATNEVFGDSWYGIRKVLTIVYRNPNGEIKTVFAEEGHRVKIEAPPQIPTILGAAYGKYNVTDQISASVADGCLEVLADNNVLGDGFENNQKSLVVVSRFGHSKPQVGIVKEHQTLKIHQINHSYNHGFTEPGQARILGAAYGLSDVTSKVGSYLQNSGLNIKADNGIFGDSWPGVRKTLVVVYQDPSGNVNTAIVEEGETLKINFEQKQKPFDGNMNVNVNGNNYNQGNYNNNNVQFQPHYGGYGNGHQPQYGQYGGGQPQYGGPYVGGYQHGGQTAQPQYQQQTMQPQENNGQQQYNNNQQFGGHAKQL